VRARARVCDCACMWELFLCIQGVPEIYGCNVIGTFMRLLHVIVNIIIVQAKQLYHNKFYYFIITCIG